METLKYLFGRNVAWANSVKRENPEFFEQLSKIHSPELLWIGCSDSRVPANQIVDLPSGAVFVHRNIANQVVHSDLNCLSVIQYAVDVLKVKSIVVCGHYGCGGINTALSEENHGLIDNWLEHVRNVHRLYARQLDALDGEAKADRLCELNVIEQVKHVSKTTIVREAWARGQNVIIHGWIYNIENGLLQDLDTSVSADKKWVEPA